MTPANALLEITEALGVGDEDSDFLYDGTYHLSITPHGVAELLRWATRNKGMAARLAERIDR